MLRMTHLSFSTQWATYFYRVLLLRKVIRFFCTFVRTKTKPVASRSQRTINSRKKCGYKFLLNSGFFSTIQNSNAAVSCCFFLFIQYLSRMTVSVSFWLTLPSMWQSVADLWPRVVWNRNLSLCVPFSPPFTWILLLWERWQLKVTVLPGSHWFHLPLFLSTHSLLSRVPTAALMYHANKLSWDLFHTFLHLKKHLRVHINAGTNRIW